MTQTHYFDHIVKCLLDNKICHPLGMRPCTLDEITVLERELDVRLPGAYKEFLLLMGHGAGDFLGGSDSFYVHLPTIQVGAKKLLIENEYQGKLPHDAFVFYMLGGYQFAYFKTSEGDDPPVYYYHEEDPTRITRKYESYTAFLLNYIEELSKFLHKAWNYRW